MYTVTSGLRENDIRIHHDPIVEVWKMACNQASMWIPNQNNTVYRVTIPRHVHGSEDVPPPMRYHAREYDAPTCRSLPSPITNNSGGVRPPIRECGEDVWRHYGVRPKMTETGATVGRKCVPRLSQMRTSGRKCQSLERKCGPSITTKEKQKTCVYL